MGLGLRTFFFDEEGKVTKITAKRFDRIREGEEPYPRAAGQYLRYALVVIEYLNRLPVAISHIEYFKLHLDEKGFNRVDDIRISPLDLLPHFGEESEDNVVDFRPHWAAKELKKMKWTPTPNDLRALREYLPGLL